MSQDMESFRPQAIKPDSQQQPNPATTGTFNILSTWLTTSVLYLWTVLHIKTPTNQRKRPLEMAQGMVAYSLTAYA